MAMKLFNHLPNIRALILQAFEFYFSLDNLVNLKNLELIGFFNDDFNFDLFENLCKQLKELSFKFSDIGNNAIAKLFL